MKKFKKITTLIILISISKNSFGYVNTSDDLKNGPARLEMLKTIRTRKLLRMPLDSDVAYEILKRNEVSKEKKIVALNAISKKNNSSPLKELILLFQKFENKNINKKKLYEILISWDKHELASSIKDIEECYKKDISKDLNNHLVAAQLRAGKTSLITSQDGFKESCLHALLILKDKNLFSIASSKITEGLLKINIKKNTENFKKSILKLCCHVESSPDVINKALIEIAINPNHPLKFDAIKSLNIKNYGDWGKKYPELELQVIKIVAEKGTMKYQPDFIEITQKKPVELIFKNLDTMDHNILICSPGSLYKIGAAADLIKEDKEAKKNNFGINLKEVLVSIKSVPPGSTKTMFFDAPSAPGEYPFVCTFPDHWRMMNGVLKVIKMNKQK